MDKEKKLWIFHHYATPPNINGFTRPYNLAKFLQEKNTRTTVFSSSYLHFSEENLIDDKSLYKIDQNSNIPFVFVKTVTGKGNGIKRIFNMLSYYFNLHRVVKIFVKNKEVPDIILASSPHPLSLIAGINIARKLKIPIITEVRDFWPEVFFMAGKLDKRSLLGKILLKIEYWIYKKSDALIFLKEGDFEYIIENKWSLEQDGEINLNKIHYINNGVDISEFNKQIENKKYIDPDLKKNMFNVVYTGAIRPVNNIGMILDAAKKIKNNADVQILIYGEGSQLSELKNRVIEEKIDNVKFKGYIDKEYIPSLLNQSSANILNYSQTNYNWTRGNSSNKLFEYMASGKPIISTIKMGYSLIERYECGITLSNNTQDELAKAILEMKNMSDEQYQKMCENSREAAKNFDYSILSDKLQRVLERVLDEKDY